MRSAMDLRKHLVKNRLSQGSQPRAILALLQYVAEMFDDENCLMWHCAHILKYSEVFKIETVRSESRRDDRKSNMKTKQNKQTKQIRAPQND